MMEALSPKTVAICRTAQELHEEKKWLCVVCSVGFVANIGWCTRAHSPLYLVCLVRCQQVSVSAAWYCADQQAAKQEQIASIKGKKYPKTKDMAMKHSD